MSNISSQRLPPIPVDVLLSAPADRADGWKWGLCNVDKAPSGRRRHCFELIEEAAERSEATG